VAVLERTNVRDLRPGDLPFEPVLVVADLSFISLRLALPPLSALAAPGAPFVLLVKPQFEVGPDRVGSGGVVRDPGAWLAAMEGVRDASAGLGRIVTAAMASPVRGPAGNVEFLVLAERGGAAADLGAAVAEGMSVRDGSRV
jgi:23S rRNA (cytidine1920-2'-O)/16S rRNA (cytidine1409-2'-O)-methyltransferase